MFSVNDFKVFVLLLQRETPATIMTISKETDLCVADVCDSIVRLVTFDIVSCEPHEVSTNHPALYSVGEDRAAPYTGVTS